MVILYLFDGNDSAVKKLLSWGAQVAQSVKHSTCDFGSGHDLTYCEMEICAGGVWSTLSKESTWDSLLPLPLPPLMFSL